MAGAGEVGIGMKQAGPHWNVAQLGWTGWGGQEGVLGWTELVGNGSLEKNVEGYLQRRQCFHTSKRVLSIITLKNMDERGGINKMEI